MKKRNFTIFNEYHFGGYGKVSDELINFVNGRQKKRNKVLEEFLEHNNEIADLIIK